jgi:hypothetical protein
MHMQKNPFGPVIYSYTTKEAVADGVLVDLSTAGPVPVYAPVYKGIRYATPALLARGYMSDAKLNLPNLADLLVQVSIGIKKGLAKGEDRLFQARIEFPDGSRGEVWAAVNEEGSLTMMLPEDY